MDSRAVDRQAVAAVAVSTLWQGTLMAQVYYRWVSCCLCLWVLFAFFLCLLSSISLPFSVSYFCHSVNGISGQRRDLYIHCILRVSDQNGVSPLYIMLEIHHSGREPLIYKAVSGIIGQRRRWLEWRIMRQTFTIQWVFTRHLMVFQARGGRPLQYSGCLQGT